MDADPTPRGMDSDRIALRLVTIPGDEMKGYEVLSASFGIDLYKMVLNYYPPPEDTAMILLCGENKLQGSTTLAKQGLRDGSLLTYTKTCVTKAAQRAVVQQVCDLDSFLQIWIHWKSGILYGIWRSLHCQLAAEWRTSRCQQACRT